MHAAVLMQAALAEAEAGLLREELAAARGSASDAAHEFGAASSAARHELAAMREELCALQAAAAREHAHAQEEAEEGAEAAAVADTLLAEAQEEHAAKEQLQSQVRSMRHCCMTSARGRAFTPQPTCVRACTRLHGNGRQIPEASGLVSCLLVKCTIITVSAWLQPSTRSCTSVTPLPPRRSGA